MKRHSPGVQVGGSTRNRISHAGTRGRLTGNPVRLTEKTGALTGKTGRATEIPRRASCPTRRRTSGIPGVINGAPTFLVSSAAGHQT